MVITSESKPKKLLSIRSSHFRSAMVYVIITFFVLLFLNINTAYISQKMFYNSKETTMIDKCHIASNTIAGLDVFNISTVHQAVSEMDSLRVSRLVVTDHAGKGFYDSMESNPLLGKYALFPEISKALEGNDVFRWDYHDGVMRSQVAVPVYSYDTLLGCVYMMEYDTQQGSLIQSLQNNILTITLILELVVILFSFALSRIFTGRVRKIMTSIRTVREGDYSHTLKMKGHDELRLLSDEFNDLIERLHQSEQTRRQFVSDASHELKTPLASIKLLSDSVLQNEMDMATVREFMEDIGNEADRLNRMSQKLLSLSRSESQQDNDFEIINIRPTMEKVIRMLQAIAEENRITITADYSGDRPILILQDDLYQILFNLVENGIKYNVAGGSLHIQLHSRDDDVIITITDTGVGIPQTSLDNIFERFYRVDKARSRKTGGSGLGLSIVRDLVQRNRGTIQVTSKEGEGSCFTITFPTFDTGEDFQ